jgi:hypothetical protein
MVAVDMGIAADMVAADMAIAEATVIAVAAVTMAVADTHAEAGASMVAVADSTAEAVSMVAAEVVSTAVAEVVSTAVAVVTAVADTGNPPANSSFDLPPIGGCRLHAANRFFREARSESLRNPSFVAAVNGRCRCETGRHEPLATALFRRNRIISG